MAIDMDAVIDRIKAILEANTTPAFTVVFAGEPLAGQADAPFAAFWYIGDGDPPEGAQTLGNRMREERFTVRAYWTPRAERSLLIDWEKEITSCKQALLAAFWGDVFLNANDSGRVVDAMTIGNVESGYVRYGEEAAARYRVLSFELALRDLNAEEEAA